MEEKQYEVIVSDRAMHMIGEHIRFLANVSKPAAKETKRELLDAIRSLSVMPMRYPFLFDQQLPINKYRKMLVKKWYLVLYQIKDHIVFVEYVVDCRNNYQWLIT